MMRESNREEWSERLLLVTAALYRVTGLLPAGEPLRTALREHANEVLAGCIGEMYGVGDVSPGLESKIEILRGFIVIARTLSEVKQENFFVLEREYRSIMGALRDQHHFPREEKTRANGGQGSESVKRPMQSDIPHTLSPKRSVASTPVRGPLPESREPNERQRAILERLAKTDTVKVSDFYEIFQGVSPKTIQRDLQDLVSKSVIKKEGEKRWTVYARA
ncbi:MAG: hypothetical protein Greene071436_129 [Parcubacteria group bacterium Greene0714_36]|nr:MAG: hypothetical protein Greene071436_129 [Parcubacteria group bacterium Greene0714_36]